MNDRLDLPNPFDTDVVSNPTQGGVIDVPQIHQRSFHACCNEYEKVIASSVSRSVLYFGQAGCGKTHLLSRFRRWLRGEMSTKPSAPPAVFVAIRMETAPTQVWRHLRRRFAEHLLETGSDGSTVLDDILERFGQGDLSGALDRSDASLTLEAVRVLEHFAAGRHRRLCKAWLKGEALADSDCEVLGLPNAAEDWDEDSGETLARSFVVGLTHLCRPDPVVFCFDQIEALGLSTGTNTFGRFTRLGATLVDETTNSLVVSSVLARYVPDLRNQASDYARIAKVEEPIEPLDWELGRLLIEARLNGVESLRAHRPGGGLDPLRERDLRKVFEEGPVPQSTARRLIHEAKRLFAAWQGADLGPKTTVEQFLQASLEELRAKSAILSEPTWMDEFLAHGLSPTARLGGFRVIESERPEIDFEAGPPENPILVTLCNQTHTNSVLHKLRRVRRAVGDDRISRLCLVRDPRLPISVKAAKTQEHLAALTGQGARLVRPDPEAVAAIDAIRRLLTNANSGDLSHNGESVPPDRVEAWLQANLPAAVTTLLDDLFSGTKAANADPLIELLKTRKVIAVEQAAQELGWPASQVVDYARANPSQAGFLEGRTPVVFHIVSAVAGGADARS